MIIHLWFALVLIWSGSLLRVSVAQALLTISLKHCKHLLFEQLMEKQWGHCLYYKQWGQ